MLYELNRVNCKLVILVIYLFNYFPSLYFKAHSHDNLKQLSVFFLPTVFLSPSYGTLVESSHFSSLNLKK